MSGVAELLIFLTLLGAVRAGYVIRKVRRERQKPRLGDADAHEGNLLLPPGQAYHHHRPGGHAAGSHGGWHSPGQEHGGLGDHGHIGHDAGGTHR
ncbi:MAG TPA: hypothetical protein VH637_11530 [Streptosporangiaceae bacterium]